MTFLRIALFAILFTFSSAGRLVFAQASPPEEPTVSFAVKAMQGAQFIRTTDTDQPSDDAEVGFQRVWSNLEVTARLHERIRGFLNLGHEPNDFGTGGNSFAPSIDFVAVDLLLTDAHASLRHACHRPLQLPRLLRRRLDAGQSAHRQLAD